jgi:hypothetical protein
VGIWTDAIRSKILSSIGLFEKRNKPPVFLQGWETMIFSAVRSYCTSYYVALFFSVILYLSGDEQDHWLIGCTTKICGFERRNEVDTKSCSVRSSVAANCSTFMTMIQVSAVRTLKQLDRQKKRLIGQQRILKHGLGHSLYLDLHYRVD